MPNIFYKIQFKTELEALNLELKNSKCKGLLIPKKLFLDKNEENNKAKVNESFIKALKTFNKEVILYENYYTIRPSLLQPNDVKDQKIKKEFVQKFENFKKKSNLKDLKKFFIKEMQDYNIIKGFSKNIIDESPKSIIERRLFKKDSNFNVTTFTLPYMPTIPSDYNGRNVFYNDLIKYTVNTNSILNNLIDDYLKQFNLENELFTITLILEDYKKNPKIINNIINCCKKFNKIGLWIIDFNEVDTTTENIRYYHDIISKFNNLDKSLYIYYSGVYSSRCIEKINPNINNIVRIDGYPGLNVNIPVSVKRTRRFYFQGNGNFYNSVSFSKKLLRTNSTAKYSCNCKVCSEYEIKDFRKVFSFYIDNPVKNQYYQEFIRKAKKTKEKKLKARQKVFLMKHNFHNLDFHLHMSTGQFRNTIFKNNLGLNNWKDFI